MQYLKNDGIIVFIDVGIDTLKKRLSNIKTRGIAASAGQSVESIYNERIALYKKYADITLTVENENVEQSVEKLKNLIKQ